MSYLKFKKEELVNLEYSLQKELVRSNRAGSFACTTIISCNTRKYHGLLISPVPELDGGNHVLLSGLDETVIQHEKEFHLGIHKFPGVFAPGGHKYIIDFTMDPSPKITFQVGGVTLSKEMIFIEGDVRILVRYTLENCKSDTTLRLLPFLAFRNVHSLSKANLYANTKYEPAKNGIKSRLYHGYPALYMQVSKLNEFVPVPHWYYNIEYIEEQRRGYDFQEDLYVPGFFEFPMKKGESIIFSAGLSELAPNTLKTRFTKEISNRIPRDSFEGNLANAARQFIAKTGKKTEIVAGYPWFGRWGRDTFISLPGLTLSLDDPATCKAVLDTMSAELHGPLFPNVGSGSHAAYNSVDAPLWYFWAIQQYAGYTGQYSQVWKDYGKKMTDILRGFIAGTHHRIKMQENGLVFAGEPGHALTWMDAIVHGKPVTPRIGYPVEIQALWYNAIRFILELAEKTGQESIVSEFGSLPERIEKSFLNYFWDPKKKYLADCVTEEGKDWTVRPNMIFAASLPYTPIEDEIRKAVVDKVEEELLTPKGLRTLAPDHPDYKGQYEGDQTTRDEAYHQGTVWPWLSGHFAEAYLRLHGRSGLARVRSLYQNFEEEMDRHGIGSISEVYDGDPPHRPGGAISQAWSVAEVLRIRSLIRKTTA